MLILVPGRLFRGLNADSNTLLCDGLLQERTVQSTACVLSWNYASTSKGEGASISMVEDVGYKWRRAEVDVVRRG